jgi:glycosyltransferase involved in cell wall biosynthesis
MQKALLSIVIPAYNVEHFIGASLTSALHQSRAEEIELIVVDDGSTDHTLERIRAVQETEAGRHIKVIHQENRGVSAARNAGIACATCPYIGFLDADDVWDVRFSEIILPLLHADSADIIEFNLGIVNTDGMQIDRMQLVDPATLGKRLCDLPALMEFAKVCQAFPVVRVYRRELWDGIDFPVGRVYEDFATIPFIYTRARTLYRLADELYYYRRRAGSITQSATLHSVKDIALCAEEALERCESSTIGGLDTYWLAIFYKAFRYTCVQTSRVPISALRESMKMVGDLEERYRRYTATRAAEALPALSYRHRIFIDRRIFQLKQLVKYAFGLQLRPSRQAPLIVQPEPHADPSTRRVTPGSR